MSDYKKIFKIIQNQEKKLVFKSFNNLDAWKLGNILVNLAFEKKLAVAIKIVVNGNTLFQYACSGSDISNEIWLQRKINMVTTVKKSSLQTFYMPLVGQDHICNDWHFPEDRYAMLGGGFPINIKGTGTIGVIGVSGLPHHQDHNLIIDGLCEFLNTSIERVIE